MSEIKIKIGGKYRAIQTDNTAFGNESVEFNYKVIEYNEKSGVVGCYYLIESDDIEFDGYYLNEYGTWIDSLSLYVKTVEVISEPAETITGKIGADGDGYVKIPAPITTLNGGTKLTDTLSLEVGNTYIDEQKAKVKIFGENSGIFAGVSENDCYNFYNKNGDILDEFGAVIPKNEGPISLVSLAPKTINIEFWVNVYKQGWGDVHYTEEDAVLNKSEMMDFVKQIHFYQEVEI